LALLDLFLLFNTSQRHADSHHSFLFFLHEHLSILLWLNWFNIPTVVGVMTYNGLEACIINSSSYDDSGISATTGADGCVTTDSLDDEVSSCSSSKDVCDSSSSHCLKQDDEHPLSELGTPNSVQLLTLKGKKPITYTLSPSDIENMKEKFAKLLLGDDSSGGARGVCTALALSNAITNLSGIFHYIKSNLYYVENLFHVLDHDNKRQLCDGSHCFWRTLEAGTIV
jgi:hypothetical protein